MYHVQTDTLGTPRTITNSSDGSLVWSWDNSEAFGNNSNINTGLEFNLRFAGQYFDEEKGSSYNINRDYASGLGRYIQSDPIGLSGGVNTYGYVQGNPMTMVDPFGLSHGSTTSMSGLDFKQMSQQIILGTFFSNETKYRAATPTQYSDYFQRRAMSNQDIFIILDACNTGTKSNESSTTFAERVKIELLTKLKEMGSTSNVRIIAPNSTIGWFLGANYFGIPINSQLNGTKGMWKEF